MNGFLVAAAVTVALVLVLLMRPFFRRIGPGTTSRQDLNSAIYREQFAKLEQDLAEGMLGKEDYAQARAELQRRLLEDAQGEEDGGEAQPAAQDHGRDRPGGAARCRRVLPVDRQPGQHDRRRCPPDGR